MLKISEKLRKVLSCKIRVQHKKTASVIANFKQVVKDGDLRLHPIVTKLVDKDVLEKMGAKPVDKELVQ